jgi:hypothetical protein
VALASLVWASGSTTYHARIITGPVVCVPPTLDTRLSARFRPKRTLGYTGIRLVCRSVSGGCNHLNAIHPLSRLSCSTDDDGQGGVSPIAKGRRRHSALATGPLLLPATPERGRGKNPFHAGLKVGPASACNVAHWKLIRNYEDVACNRGGVDAPILVCAPHGRRGKVCLCHPFDKTHLVAKANSGDERPGAFGPACGVQEPFLTAPECGVETFFEVRLGMCGRSEDDTGQEAGKGTAH